MATHIHIHRSAPSAKRTVDAKPHKTRDCGCGGHETADESLAQKIERLEDRIQKAERGGVAGMEIERMKAQLRELKKSGTDDGAYDAKPTRDAGEPVNAAWLKLDRLAPEELARRADTKGVKASGKTDMIMGLLRAEFQPQQIEAWSLYF